MYNIYSFKKKSPPYLVDGFEALQLDTGLHQSSGKLTGLNATDSMWYVENKCNRFLNATSGASGKPDSIFLILGVGWFLSLLAA